MIIGCKYDFLQDWRLSAEIEMRDSVYTSAVSDGELGSYAVLNAEISYTMEDYLIVFARASNINGKDYFVYDGWKGFSVKLLVGLEIRF